MTDTLPAHPPRIPPEHARSWLLVAATDEPRVRSAHTCSADAIIYDLEDGVVPHTRLPGHSLPSG